jgi:hypothetical protein
MLIADETGGTNINISIDISENNEILILNFKTEDRCIKVGFNIQEAQLLSIMLGESVTSMLLNKMQLFPHPSENIH